MTTPTPNHVREFLQECADDLPDPNACPYCGEAIREHEMAPVSQRVELSWQEDGTLDIDDWHDYTSHDSDGERTHYSCAGYEHLFDTLADLAREQEEQHALRIVMMSAPDHVWNEEGDEPGTELRLRTIYAVPMFAGRRARMAQKERHPSWDIERYAWRRTARWQKFLALDTPPPVASADRTERELAAAGIL